MHGQNVRVSELTGKLKITLTRTVENKMQKFSFELSYVMLQLVSLVARFQLVSDAVRSEMTHKIIT